RSGPHSGPTHEGESAGPTPLTGVGVSRWSLDPRRQRRYLQIAFGLAALVVALLVLYLVRDFIGAFVLGGAIAFLVQPAVTRVVAVGVPRIVAIIIVFLL